MSKYLNRELSWLEFNQRVLEEAQDAENPLLERLKFLAITASNLDEFFMVRVGGLQQLAAQSGNKTDIAGLTADEQLEAIRKRTGMIVTGQYACLLDEIEPGLAEAGFRRLDGGGLSEEQLKFVERLFDQEISAVLTPMAVFGSEEFPLLMNGTLNVCVSLDAASKNAESRFAVIPFGNFGQRFITLPSEQGHEYITLEDVVALFVERLFNEEPVTECVPFRITRNADMGIREDQAADLMSGMEEILDARKQSACVRLEIADDCSAESLAFLKRTLDVTDTEVYSLPGPLDLAAFMRMTDVKGFQKLRDESWSPQPSPAVDPSVSMFETLTERDLLLYHPFESFDPVLRLLEEAAADPDVLAIKQTLYRTSRNSPVVAALMKAAERGKYVTALVELKARFDEARNIQWAKQMEEAGVQVIYGVRGLKTHAKICVVVRREPGGIRRYTHFGTGNYNEATSRIYTDASLMTSQEELGADATAFFNAVSGYSEPRHFHKIAIAPTQLREKLLELIEGEVQRKKQGQKARIRAKLNSLADQAVIDGLYAASQAGVEISLCVRGICCLRPGVKDLSENIEVVSIVDRFLEHSRIFNFHHGGDSLVFLSSADWMPRNLDRRVELMVPVEDPACRNRLVDILKSSMRDNVKGRVLKSDGSYERRTPGKRGPRRSQTELCEAAVNAVKNAEETRRIEFEPYRAADAG